MKPNRWIAAFFLALVAAGQGIGGEPAPGGFLQRVSPAGGWHPYGGGLLGWWDPHCFPRGGGPDDYCRKSLPKVCWPPYPPYYVSGTPPYPPFYISGTPQASCPLCTGTSNEPHEMPRR